MEENEIEKTGIDDNGKDLMVYTTNKPKWITPTKLQYPSGRTVSIDPNEGACEVYNPNKLILVLISNHPFPVEKLIDYKVTIPPDSFGLMRHRYYTPYWTKNGKDFIVDLNLTVVLNHGTQMFKGNKKASRPTTKKNFY